MDSAQLSDAAMVVATDTATEVHTLTVDTDVDWRQEKATSAFGPVVTERLGAVEPDRAEA